MLNLIFIDPDRVMSVPVFARKDFLQNQQAIEGYLYCLCRFRIKFIQFKPIEDGCVRAFEPAVRVSKCENGLWKRKMKL